MPAVVVVVKMLRTAFLVGELPHDDGAHAATSPTANGADRRDTDPEVHGPIIVPGPPGRARAAWPGHFKMLTARATTRIPTTREIADSAIIMSFAQVLTADTSVGLKAVAVANAKWK